MWRRPGGLSIQSRRPARPYTNTKRIPRGGHASPPILIGKFDRIGFPDAKLSVTDFRVKKSDERRIDVSNQVACVPLLVELLEKKTGVDSVSTIGHRVVHGGPRYRDAVRVDGAVLEEL